MCELMIPLLLSRGIVINVCTNLENPANSLLSSYYWCSCEILDVACASKLSLSACEIGYQISGPCSKDNNRVHQEPNGCSAIIVSHSLNVSVGYIYTF